MDSPGEFHRFPPWISSKAKTATTTTPFSGAHMVRAVAAPDCGGGLVGAALTGQRDRNHFCQHEWMRRTDSIEVLSNKFSELILESLFVGCRSMACEEPLDPAL